MAAYDDPRRAPAGDDDDALLRPTLRPGIDATRYAPLFNPASLVYAAFFGGLAAGAALFAANFRRMRRPRLAALTFGIGVAVTAGYVVYVTRGVNRGAFDGEDGSAPRTYRTAFQIVSAVVGLVLARYQKADFNAYLAGGGKPRKALAPSIAATLLGLAFVVLVVFATMLADESAKVRGPSEGPGKSSQRVRASDK